MRVRTYLGFLVTVGSGRVGVLSDPPEPRSDVSVVSRRRDDRGPLYFAFIGLFLIGFLPAGTVLLTRTIQQELALRKQRKAQREEKAQRAAFQRGVDFLADGQPARAVASFQELLASSGPTISCPCCTTAKRCVRWAVRRRPWRHIDGPRCSIRTRWPSCTT